MNERVVVEVEPGRPLRYIAGFGKSRRLPDNGALPVEHIQRVVVGWSNQDEAWHLGLVLVSELAQARGSRWCEVAHWPDPQTNAYSESATRAGEALAQAVTRPFYLVPPQVAEEEKPAVVKAPPPPLPELPLTLESWRFERASQDKFQFIRARSGAPYRRIIWYAFWTVIYVILVVATLTSGIAPAKPEILPYLGVFSAVVLVGLIIKNIYHLYADPDCIVIDSTKRTVRALNGRRERWKIAPDQLQSVYVTLVTGKTKGKRPVFHYGELNLQLSNGDFHYMLDVEQSGTFSRDLDNVEDTETIVPLIEDNVYTDLQAVGIYVARALDVPCWYDRRL
jgi:hypothetical protein